MFDGKAVSLRNRCRGALARFLAGVALALASCAVVSAQTQTVGLFLNDTASFAGYTLWEPMQGTTVCLIDPYGRKVHTWPVQSKPQLSVYLLPNGNCLKAAQTTYGCSLREYDWDGNVVWSYEDADSSYHQHHDIQPLPNGNVLILADEFKTPAEALASGRDSTTPPPGDIYSIEILELRPTGPTSAEVVWEWHLWDHLIQDVDSTKLNFGVVADHPELLDINIGSPYSDWLHANSVAYNADLDQIVWSSRIVSEIYVIDHSTTTAEAAGHTGGAHGRGGDFLYRWGNPQNYRAGDVGDQQFFYQHDAQWIPSDCPGAGHLLVFNNGNGRGYSSVDEIIPPIDGNGDYVWPSPGEPFGPTDLTWTFVDQPPESFFAWFISGAQRLPNGNTLINYGTEGEFFEVTPSGKKVWRYVNPVAATGNLNQGAAPNGNQCFRAHRYAADYPAFDDRNLTPQAAFEVYPITISGSSSSPAPPAPSDTAVVITATILSSGGALTEVEALVATGGAYVSYPMLDDGAHGDGAAHDRLFGAVVPRPSTATDVTYYLRAVNTSDDVVTDPPNPPLTVYRFDSGMPCGNVDGQSDGGTIANVSDLTYLVAFLFQGGPPPPDPAAANLDGVVNGGTPVDISDLTYLVAFLFQGGPAPVC